MATIYVSYKGNEEPFVKNVVDRLEPKHEIFVDYKMPPGVVYQKHMLAMLKSAEVFVVFISTDTKTSSYQNAEIGAARFCHDFVDQKLIIPILIDQVPLPNSIKDIDIDFQTNRDPDQIAQSILDAIDRRKPPIRLFISHSHQDEDLASRLVDVIISGLQVPQGAIRCTSVPGYQLDMGAMAPEALRLELGSAACVIAILTPNSIANDWVLFELGASWANTIQAIPLFAGGVDSKAIPGPFRGATGGELKKPITLDRLVDQLERDLKWRQNNNNWAQNKRYDLAGYAEQKIFPQALKNKRKI